MTKEEKKNMSIANCRICLLSKSNCANCPLSWVLDFLDIEKTLKVIEIPLNYISDADLASTSHEGYRLMGINENLV